MKKRAAVAAISVLIGGTGAAGFLLTAGSASGSGAGSWNTVGVSPDRPPPPPPAWLRPDGSIDVTKAPPQQSKNAAGQVVDVPLGTPPSPQDIADAVARGPQPESSNRLGQDGRPAR